MTELFFVVAIIVVLGIAFVVLSRRSGEAAPDDSARDPEMEDGVVSEPVPVAAAVKRDVVTGSVDTRTPAPSNHQGNWSKDFESRSGALSDEARLRLINDLGLIRAPWCVELLKLADREETAPAHRIAVELALARCRGVVAPESPPRIEAG